MTPTPDDRDPVVAEALDRLSPPDPSPAFWSMLDDELRQVAPRRRSWQPGWPALAAAAVVVLAAIAAVVLANRTDDPAPIADPTSTTTSSTTSTTNTTVLTPPGEPTNAASAVLAWVDALHAGDDARAASLLAPNSAQWAAEQSGTAEAFMIQLHEGYGAWGGSTDRTTKTMKEISHGSGAAWIVTLIGTVEQEGTRAFRAVALPVLQVDGRYLVEAFDLADHETRIEFVQPEIGTDGQATVAAGDLFEIVAPNAGTLTLQLDDEPAFTLTPDSRGVVRFLPMDGPLPLARGEHLLVIASVGADHLTAAVLRFTVR
jgi:hypothetical protein